MLTANDMIALFSAILAIAALTISIVEICETLYSKRKETFTLLNKILAEDSFRLRKFIGEHASEAKIPGNYEYNHLIYNKEWNYKCGPLANIETVSLIANNTKNSFRKTISCANAVSKLPLRNRSIADNLRLFENAKIFDAPAYAIRSIFGVYGKIEISIRKGSYFDFINTCFGYGFEAAYSFMLNKNNNSRTKFALRSKFNITAFDNRFAAVGITTIVMFLNVKSGKEVVDLFLVHLRGDDVAESKGLICAVPAGSFQPSYDTSAINLQQALDTENMKHTIVREFCEEILSLEEFSEMTTPKEIEKNPVWGLLENRIFYLGCGLNPINAFFEVLTCAAIDMKEESAKLFFGDSLEAIEEKIKPNNEGTISFKPLTPDILKHYEHSVKTAPDMKLICQMLNNNFDTIMNQISNMK